MNVFTEMATTFPLMRGGGAFLVAIGLGIVVGAFGGRRMRLVALITGAGIGVVIMAVGGATKLIFAGVGPPPLWHWGVLAVAYLAEVWFVNIVLRKIPDTDSRAFWLWILFIVGAHFLILGVSHGPLCALLALLCMANALVGLRATRIPVAVFWAVDGALKVLAGVAMITLSY